MEIFPTIEALLHYANTHLLLDELDYVYARNRILDLLRLEEYEEYEVNVDEIDAMTSPVDILDALSNYAVSHKIIAEADKPIFAKRLMDCVLKRPGEIADVFGRLAPARAFEWLNDYGVKSGFIKPVNKKWDAKATKGKREVAFSGCVSCGGGSCSKSAYPACGKCRDNEGFGKNLNMRSVPLDLYGERMFFYFYKRPVMQNQGLIVGEYHRPLVMDKTALNKMFDFAAMMPGWVIAARDSEHENYNVCAKPLPFNKAPDIAKFKSPEYPYITVTTIDWYIGAVRLICTNREKLIEYAEKLVAKWKATAEGNTAAVSLRKIDTNFCLELIFLNNEKQITEEYNNLTKLSCAFNLMGVFSLDQKIEDQMAQIQRFLTKEEKFSPAKLEGELSVHSNMINRLITGQGSSKITGLEAALDVKDEINKILENALISMNVPIDVLYGNF